MRGVLLFSVLLNLYLGYEVWALRSKPPLERTVIETHSEALPPQEVVIKLEQEPKKNEPSPTAPQLLELDEVLDKVASEREEFLTQELHATPLELEQIESIKREYQAKFQSVLGKGPLKVEMSLEERKRFLDLETQRERDFERVLGRKRFQRFQKFKQKYNERMVKRQANGKGSVFVPIDL